MSVQLSEPTRYSNLFQYVVDEFCNEDQVSLSSKPYSQVMVDGLHYGGDVGYLQVGIHC